MSIAALGFSIVVEWDNARSAELRRPQRMLAQLAAQLAALQRTRFALRHVLFVYDRNSVPRALIEREAGRALGAVLEPRQLRLLDTDGLHYYELKNFGARRCEGDVVVFLDSDTVPEDEWLARLLSPLRDPRVAVVAGTCYVEPEDYFSRTLALWWFFPTRDERTGVREVKRFWANNVAFRRELFLATGFPQAPAFRGQCILLAERLTRAGVRIMERVDARVGHPAPNGWRRLARQALCEGHDRVFLLDMASRPQVRAWRASWRRFRIAFDAARGRIRAKRSHLGLSPLGAAGAVVFAAAYFALNFVGERVALRRPALIRKYFAM